MTRTMAGAALLLLAGCSVEGLPVPKALAVGDPGRPHLGLSLDGTMSFGVRRAF